MLRPGGRMIYVVPGAEHLYQMKAVLYEKPYKNPVQQIAYDGFAAIGEREVTGRVTVPHEQLEALFAMTPYYWKTPRAGRSALLRCPSWKPISRSGSLYLKSCNDSSLRF